MIIPSVYFTNAAKGIKWLEEVAGFKTTVRYDGKDGSVMHAELEFGGHYIMVGTASSEKGQTSPDQAGGRTHGIYIVLKDAPTLEAHYEHAKAQGGSIDKEPFTTAYGSRDYSLKDPEGHIYYYGTYKPGDQIPTPACAESGKEA